MGLVEILLFLLVAAICGSLGMALGGYSHGGCLLSAAVGLVGALLGGWLSARLGLPEILSLNVGGRPFPIVWTIIGSTLFVALLGFLRRARV
jgi:uncharacterized membrane protein YeaQ/YmgE (transglycosylase-associated protein family)